MRALEVLTGYIRLPMEEPSEFMERLAIGMSGAFGVCMPLEAGDDR